MLAEAEEVAGEGAVVLEAPVAELGGVGELDPERDQQEVEEDGDQAGPAQVGQPPPPTGPGTARKRAPKSTRWKWTSVTRSE